jgi:hypothetical protein
VSEREQAEAVKLLVAWMAAKTEEERAALRARTEHFLKLPVGPESHGSRRS